MSYEFMDHTADVKVRVKAHSLATAFSEAALALKETICGDVAVRARIEREINVVGNDRQALLYSFLEEFLYLLDAKGFLLAGVEAMSICGCRLRATVRGDNAARYAFSNAVKAVTYNQMSIRRKGRLWTMVFVLDV